VTFTKELERLEIPVLLTIQIDIVPKPGQQPVVIPPNLEAAVNFFQSERPLHERRMSWPKIRDGSRSSEIVT